MEESIRKAIEESFPVVEINRLAIPERNAFKPIYQMHKWVCSQGFVRVPGNSAGSYETWRNRYND